MSESFSASNTEFPADFHTEYSAADSSFDVDKFTSGLDAIFAAHKASTDAEPYLLEALQQTIDADDQAAQLTVLNELMGFYRSQGKHQENMRIAQISLDLALSMGLEGTETWATVLINAATAMRAAGEYDQSKMLYDQALTTAQKVYSPHDRRLAALHNNLSILYSQMGSVTEAENQLREALSIITDSSTDPDNDIDVATSHTNLALLLLDTNQLDEALSEARAAIAIYNNDSSKNLKESAHYASALAGYAQALLRNGNIGEAINNYRDALEIIEERYGVDTDYYRTTKQNLDTAIAIQDQVSEMKKSDVQLPPETEKQEEKFVESKQAAIHSDSQVSSPTIKTIKGLELSKAYWEKFGKPLLNEKYSEYQSRIAVGLVGHGSECYGFDDEISHDHDFGPGFCLWLTTEDYAKIGEKLQADYDQLPKEFMGYSARVETPRAQGKRKRVGVFSIDEFFESITGLASAPSSHEPHLWLSLDEATLAAATNGRIFTDQLGAFSSRRQGFKNMPEDVRLSLISRRLGMISQSGQYNVERMLKRNDSAGAMMAISQFVDATSSLVFLMNNPLSAGYAPYYKWRFAGLRALSSRMATRLPQVCEQLESVLRLASAACYGGASFGEGGKGSSQAQKELAELISSICTEIANELRVEELSTLADDFLEWHRPYVESHIESSNPILRSL